MADPSTSTAESDHAMATFSRDQATGALTYQGCISGDTATTGCTPIGSATVGADNSGMERRPRARRSAPTATPSTRPRSATTRSSHFSRDTGTGALTYQGCITGDTAVPPRSCVSTSPVQTRARNNSGLD